MKICELIELLEKNPLDAEIKFRTDFWVRDEDILVEKEYDIYCSLLNEDKTILFLSEYDMGRHNESF
jgi:hypothetical protein